MKTAVAIARCWAGRAKTVLILRTCAPDMTAHGGFRWPESGPVECPDWNPEPECGHGLHGLLWGEGDGELIQLHDGKAKWLVVAVEESLVVKIDEQKCKFPRGEVVYYGDQEGATQYILANGGAGRAVAFATVTAGDEGHATAGHYGKATAGDGGKATAGDGGKATAGDQGQATAGNYGQATAGNYGQATAGDGGKATAGDGGKATAGHYGKATAGDGGKATAGDQGQATAGHYGHATAGYQGHATAGYQGHATAGEGGELRIRWHDGKRYRTVVGYVGENGIEANRAYRVENGKFVG